MKRILVFVLVFVLGAAGGAAGVAVLAPGLLHKTPPASTVAYSAQTGVTVTESGIESNLADVNHYIRFDIEFAVSPQALTAAGGTVAGAQGGSGTGSAILDARIRNALVDVCRSTSYGAVSTSGGLSTFKADVSEVLQSIFGPGSIGPIYFSSVITQ